MEALLGEIVTELSDATFRVDDAVKFPYVPEIVVDPLLKVVAEPWVPELLLTLATAGLAEVHEVLVVTSFVVPSLRLTDAWNC
jgi:hypothetical protein